MSSGRPGGWVLAEHGVSSKWALCRGLCVLPQARLWWDLGVPVSSSFRVFIVDQLSRVVPQLRARGMFGGVGMYAGQLFFALIADDRSEERRVGKECRSRW